MASGKLYQAALAFRKTKLWTKILDDQLFAVSLSNGQIGYCCVMGALGEHLALGLYVGADALQSYYRMRRPPVLGCPSLLHEQETLLSQNCLQCSFESMSMLSKEEITALRTYTKQHQITLRGKNACPQFTKYVVACPFYPITSPSDELMLTEALLAALAVAERVDEQGGDWLEPLDMDRSNQTIPLLTPAKDGFAWSQTNLPPVQAEEYPMPILKDELLLNRLKRAPKNRAHWALDAVMTPVAAMNSEPDTDAPAFFPYILIGICCKSEELLLLPETVHSYDMEQAERLLTALGRWMLEQGVPSDFTTYNQRTYSLLQNLTQQLDIGLKLETNANTEELAMLIDAEDGLAEQVEAADEGSDDADEELELFFDFLATADDDQLRTIPDFVWRRLVDDARQGMFPPELAKRILHAKR